jgi:hypothetical protein
VRHLLPAPPEQPSLLFYEIDVAETPASLVVSGFDGRHRVVSGLDVRHDGKFGLSSTLLLGENATAVEIALSQTAGALVVIEGTIAAQPFEVMNSPSKPHVVQAPELEEADAATVAHWQTACKGLFGLALAVHSYEPRDQPWGVEPCQLLAGAIVAGTSACLRAASDEAALDVSAHAILAATVYITEGACVLGVPPLADVGDEPPPA